MAFGTRDPGNPIVGHGSSSSGYDGRLLEAHEHEDGSNLRIVFSGNDTAGFGGSSGWNTFIVSSSDGGATWGTPAQIIASYWESDVHDQGGTWHILAIADGGTGGALRYFTASDPTGTWTDQGTVLTVTGIREPGIVYDSTNSLWHVFAAYSSGGTTKIGHWYGATLSSLTADANNPVLSADQPWETPGDLMESPFVAILPSGWKWKYALIYIARDATPSEWFQGIAFSDDWSNWYKLPYEGASHQDLANPILVADPTEATADFSPAEGSVRLDDTNSQAIWLYCGTTSSGDNQIHRLTVTYTQFQSLFDGWVGDASYKKSITVQDTNVDSDLTDFPLLVTLADADIGKQCRPDAGDIFFSTGGSEATLLPFEVKAFGITGDGSTTAFTANASTDVFTSAGHGLSDGDAVVVSTSSALPTGLMAGQRYWIVNSTTDTFQLSIVRGGSAVDVSDTGTGTHSWEVAIADGAFWVKVPSIAASGGATLYVNYGDGKSSRADPTNVYDSGYAAVYSKPARSHQWPDSLGVANGTTSAGTLALSAGIISDLSESAIDFQTNSYVQIPNNAVLNLTAAIAIEVLCNPDTVGAGTAANPMFTKQQSGVSNGYRLALEASNEVRFSLKESGGDHSVVTTDSQNPAGSDYHIVGDWDGSTMKVYQNGAANATTTSFTGNPDTNSQPAQIGAFSAGSTYFDGVIDLVRIHNQSRSAAWWKFTSANIKEADNELTFGSEQSATAIAPASLHLIKLHTV